MKVIVEEYICVLFDAKENKKKYHCNDLNIFLLQKQTGQHDLLCQIGPDWVLPSC